MGDLISRSALIEVLTKEQKQDRSKAYGEHECDLIAGTIGMCADFVKAMPTAYDVEKVVEQEENFLVNFGIPKNTKVHRKIVDIVKRGGVDVSK